MDNFVLFICGITITLISGMGVLVYMVNLGYKQTPKGKLPEISVEIPVEENKSMDSFVDIPSVS
jgi:hypothetical protein